MSNKTKVEGKLVRQRSVRLREDKRGLWGDYILWGKVYCTHIWKCHNEGLGTGVSQESACYTASGPEFKSLTPM